MTTNPPPFWVIPVKHSPSLLVVGVPRSQGVAAGGVIGGQVDGAVLSAPRAVRVDLKGRGVLE